MVPKNYRKNFNVKIEKFNKLLTNTLKIAANCCIFYKLGAKKCFESFKPKTTKKEKKPKII